MPLNHIKKGLPKKAVVSATTALKKIAATFSFRAPICQDMATSTESMQTLATSPTEDDGHDEQ
jgi:hypothetical protein